MSVTQHINEAMKKNRLHEPLLMILRCSSDDKVLADAYKFIGGLCCSSDLTYNHVDMFVTNVAECNLL